MSTPAVTPPSGGTKWYTKQINGKWYKTQAASPDEAKTKFGKVGGQKTTTGQPAVTQKPAAESEFDRGARESLGISTPNPGYGDIAKATASGVGHFVKSGVQDYTKAFQQHPIATSAMIPLFPLHLMAKGIEGMADQVEKSTIPDIEQGHLAHAAGGLLGTAAQAGFMRAAGEAGGAGLKMVGDKITPEALRTAAGRLNVKATGTEISEKAIDPKEMAQAGKAMAEAKVVGTKLTLPRKLQTAIAQKLTVLDQSVKQADQTSQPRDVTKALDTAVDAAKQRAAALGNKKALADLDKWKMQQSSTLDPKTGKWSPRSMMMKPSELLKQSRLLEHDAGWEGGKTPEHIENAAKIYRKATNDLLDESAPGTAKLRNDVSELIKNREAAKAQAEKAFEGTSRMIKSYFSSPGTLAAFALMKGMGFPWLGSIAAVVGLKTMFDSTASRTVRAALLQTVGDWLDGKSTPVVNKVTPPVLPPSANAGPSGPSAPSAPPAAPTQLRLPSGPATQTTPEATPQHAQLALQAAVGAETGGSATKAPEAPISQPSAAKPLPSNNLGANAQPPVQRVAEGQSGMGPKAKAMLDRLDELTQRQPKSGKERQDIQREIEQIRTAMKSGTSPDEVKAINKKIVDRERQARHREKVKSETPGAVSTGAAEATATGGSPEDQVSLIEAGLNKLKSMGSLGKTTAEATKREAKLHKWSAAEQMAHIAEQIEFLKTHPEFSDE